MTSVVTSPTASIIRVLIGVMLSERRRLIFALTIAAATIAALTAWLYSSLGVNYDELLADMPEAMVAMLGDADLGTPAGWLQVELFSFVGPGLAIGAGVSVAAGALAGAEERGQLTLITTGPTRRSVVARAALAAMLIAVATVTAGLFVGIMVGSNLGSLDISSSNVAAACLSLALLGGAVGAITLAAGAFTGDRGTAAGIGTASAVVSYAVDAFFPLSESLAPFAKFTLWYPFAANEPLINGLSIWHLLTFGLVISSSLLAALVGFERRDLGP